MSEGLEYGLGLSPNDLLYGIACGARGSEGRMDCPAWICWLSSALWPAPQKTPRRGGTRPRGWRARRAPASAVL